jgi:D-lactate dehydrogenase (cytochrome)
MPVTRNYDISELRQLLPDVTLLTDPVELIVYEMDAAQESGLPEGVIFPTTAEQVCQIAAWAARRGVPLVGRGAGTGLSGGAVAERGGLVVEFSRMRQVLELDLAGRSVTVQPGLTNLELDELVRAQGLYYPPDPASGRSASLGGNVAENAGGPHCFKYGVTTNYLTGLEFAAGEGRLFRSGGPAYDYPEYDFTSLLTGSEGTLGLVTRIQARLVGLPPAVSTAMAAFASVEQAGGAVSAVIAAGLVPSTLEMMDQKIAQIIEAYAHPGLPQDAGAILLLEVDGYPESLDAQMAEAVSILEAHGAQSVRIAASAAERERIWFARKSAAGAMARLAPAYMLLDGTVPRSSLAQALEITNRICERHDLRVGYVFHAGDGNLHPFILMYPSDRDQVRRVHVAGREFMEAVVALDGSITGEHGVGIEKRPFLSLMYGMDEIGAMLDVKRVLDPQGIFNPGKIFPQMQRGEVETRPRRAAEVRGRQVFEPESPEEAASVMRVMRGAGIMLRVASGLAGEGDPGKAPADGRAVLYTGRLGGLKTLALSDLYVRAGAGMKLADLQARLAEHGMGVQAASPWEETTLGGLLAENLNAPLRLRGGGLRDQVLELSLVLPDGRLLRLGRPVVKNVAGYDLARFMVGTRGSLGLITEVTLKILPLPRLSRSLWVPVYDFDSAVEAGLALLGGPVAVAGVVLARRTDLKEGGLALPGRSPFGLVVSVEGHPQDVEAELGGVHQRLEALGLPLPQEMDVTAVQAWQAFLRLQPAGDVLRLGLPPGRLPEFVRQHIQLRDHPLLLDFGSGFAYAGGAPDREKWGALAVQSGGYATALGRPGWRFPLPDTLELEQRLKKLWDPGGLLPDSW